MSDGITVAKLFVFWGNARIVSYKQTDISEVLIASIIRTINKLSVKKQKAGQGQMLVNSYVTTRRQHAQHNRLHTRHPQNLKTHLNFTFYYMYAL
jgi:hypothetical protein